MTILRSCRSLPARRFQTQLLWGAVCVASPMLGCGAASADPILPTIGSTVYNVSLPNGGVVGASIDGGLVAIPNGTTDNRSVINAFITYASSHGGGTVEIPAPPAPTLAIPNNTYMSNILSLRSGVNLQVDTGATVQNLSTTNGLLSTSGSALHDIELSGGGVLNNNASSIGNNMVTLQNIQRVEVTGVTIENAAAVHLVMENDTNATVNAITIQDPLVVQKNTDGIDFSGTHFLIENSNISDGDDNIVAKPQSTFTSDVTIQNDTIGIGHGISVGGQTNAGLNGMTVNNITFNGTDNGFRLKAGRGNGGLVQNLSFNNVTMTNVANPIFISSWYNNGTDQYPGLGPAKANAVAFNSVTTPQWKNITFSNITSSTIEPGSNSGIIYATPESPVDSLTFDNVSLSSNKGMQINFAGYTGAYDPTPNPADEVLFEDSSINGTLLTDSSVLSNSFLFTGPINGLFDDVLVFAVPEPSSAILMVAGAALLFRRPRFRIS